MILGLTRPHEPELDREALDIILGVLRPQVARDDAVRDLAPVEVVMGSSLILNGRRYRIAYSAEADAPVLMTEAAWLRGADAVRANLAKYEAKKG